MEVRLGVALRVQCVQPFGAIFGAGDGPVDESPNLTLEITLQIWHRHRPDGFSLYETK